MKNIKDIIVYLKDVERISHFQQKRIEDIKAVNKGLILLESINIMNNHLNRIVDLIEDEKQTKA